MHTFCFCVTGRYTYLVELKLRVSCCFVVAHHMTVNKRLVPVPVSGGTERGVEPCQYSVSVLRWLTLVIKRCIKRSNIIVTFN